MSAADQIQDDATQRFIREQIERIDREQARYCRLREDSEPRIDAMLARARREWDEQDRRDQAAERRRSRWRVLASPDMPLVISAIGLTLSAIGLFLCVLVVAYVLS